MISPGATAPIADPISLTLLGPDDIHLGAKWITDLELRYRAFGHLELAIGADNVFDVYPDRSPFGAAPGGDRRRLSDQPILSALFGLLAVRLQRPLPLRARLGRLLSPGGQLHAAVP